MNELTKDVNQKVGKPGQQAPIRITHVTNLPCPSVSDDEVQVHHSLIHEDAKSYCEFCKVSWVDLDADVRKKAKADAKRKQESNNRNGDQS